MLVFWFFPRYKKYLRSYALFWGFWLQKYMNHSLINILWHRGLQDTMLWGYVMLKFAYKVSLKLHVIAVVWKWIPIFKWDRILTYEISCCAQNNFFPVLCKILRIHLKSLKPMQVSFFCRIIFQSESLLVHQLIYSNYIYNNIVEKP